MSRNLSTLRKAIPGARRSKLATKLDRLGNTALGSVTSLAVTAAGATTLLEAADRDRAVLICVTVTTVFADGNGAQPTLAIGETSSTSKFAATTLLASAAAASGWVLGGTLSANKALLATSVAGTGTATGATRITVIVLPTA